MSDSNLTETQDYDKGAVPTAHKTSHQHGGSDEIIVAGLSGELADNQPPKAHDLAGAKHNADTLAHLNDKIIDATLDDSADTRTPSAHKTSHQDAGSDEISVSGLNGVLADKQDADKIQSFPVDAAQAADDGKVLAYNHAGTKYEHVSAAGVSDHGALTGLADDDHTQYHNNARGDARYILIENFLSNFQFADMYANIIQGTWNYFMAASQAYGFFFSNTSPAQNDEIEYYIFAENGNKTLIILCGTGTASGILSVYLDDTLQGTIDLLSPATAYNIIKTLSLTVVGTYTHSLKLKVATKNAGSTSYGAYLTSIRIV